MKVISQKKSEKLTFNSTQIHFNFNQPQLNMAVTSKRPDLVYSRKILHTKINLYDGNFDISIGKFRNIYFEKKANKLQTVRLCGT